MRRTCNGNSFGPATFLSGISANWAQYIRCRRANENPDYRTTMKVLTVMRAVTILVLLCAGISVLSESVSAQVMDFSQIDAFESIGTGTLHGASPPKTIIDDDERHAIFITVLESDADAKVYWKSLDGSPQTTILHGPGVHAFQTNGELKLEALGSENQSVKYGYLLLCLRK
jgi:hypothetical protein